MGTFALSNVARGGGVDMQLIFFYFSSQVFSFLQIFPAPEALLLSLVIFSMAPHLLQLLLFTILVAP